MKRILILLVCALLCGCQSKQEVSAQQNGQNPQNQSDKSVRADEAEQLKSLYFELDSLLNIGKFDRVKAQIFVNQAFGYFVSDPDDTLSPKFLYCAAVMQKQYAFTSPDLAEREEQAMKAIGYFEKLRKTYQSSPYLMYVFYNQGQIYESLGRVEDAKRAYTDLVHRFPDTDLGKNIAAYLKSGGIGMSGDEMWEQMQK